MKLLKIRLFLPNNKPEVSSRGDHMVTTYMFTRCPHVGLPRDRSYSGTTWPQVKFLAGSSLNKHINVIIISLIII